MSKNKIDFGFLYKKLHSIQKRIVRWTKNKKTARIQEAMYREKKLLDRIKAGYNRITKHY